MRSGKPHQLKKIGFGLNRETPPPRGSSTSATPTPWAGITASSGVTGLWRFAPDDEIGKGKRTIEQDNRTREPGHSDRTIRTMDRWARTLGHEGRDMRTGTFGHPDKDIGQSDSCFDDLRVDCRDRNWTVTSGIIDSLSALGG